MKHAKKLLALLLALLLGLGLSATAMAEDGDTAQADEVSQEVNWDDFYIISQPPAELTIPFGEEFTLSVEVNVPEGAEVSYRWYKEWDNTSGSDLISDSTEPNLHCSPGDSYYPANSGIYIDPFRTTKATYFCIITAKEMDKDGNVVATKHLRSDNATVTLDQTLFEKFKTNIGISLNSAGLLLLSAPLLLLPVIVVIGGMALAVPFLLLANVFGFDFWNT